MNGIVWLIVVALACFFLATSIILSEDTNNINYGLISISNVKEMIKTKAESTVEILYNPALNIRNWQN